MALSDAYLLSNAIRLNFIRIKKENKSYMKKENKKNLVHVDQLVISSIVSCIQD